MASLTTQPFSPPAIPWRQPRRLVLAGTADAERLSGSRWHVFGDVAREGKVLHVAS